MDPEMFYISLIVGGVVGAYYYAYPHITAFWETYEKIERSITELQQAKSDMEAKIQTNVPNIPDLFRNR